MARSRDSFGSTKCVEANVVELFPIFDPFLAVRRELCVRLDVNLDEAGVRDDGAGVLAESQDILILDQLRAGFEKHRADTYCL